MERIEVRIKQLIEKHITYKPEVSCAYAAIHAIYRVFKSLYGLRVVRLKSVQVEGEVKNLYAACLYFSHIKSRRSHITELYVFLVCIWRFCPYSKQLR